MAKKSLIVYQSMTGNTEKVAFKFKEVFEKKDWEVTTFRVDKNTDPHKLPFTLEGFDFLCVGCPVIDSAPSKYLYRFLLDNPDAPMYRGSNPTERLKKLRPGMFGGEVTVPAILGIAFVTYSGSPPEAMPSLRLLEHEMWYMRVECVGQFACRGTEPRHAGVNYIADRWYPRNYAKGETEFDGRGDIEEAAEVIGRYAENPNHPDFASMSKEERDILDAAVKDTLPDTHVRAETGPPMPMPTMPPREKRPSARDLLKAEIFLEEILEETPGRGPFLCIA